MNRRRQAQVTPEQVERSTRIYYYWLLLALFLEYARPASYFAFLRVPFLYSAIPLSLFVATCFAPGMRSMREILADPLTKWIPIFVALIAFSFAHADVSLYVYNIFKLVLGYAIMFIMIARIVTSEARFRGVIATLLLAHLFLLAMNPAVVMNPNERNYIIGATFLGDGNDFSMSLCILIPFAISMALGATTRWGRWFAWAGVGIGLLAIIASQSRGAALGLGAVLIYLWLISPRKMAVLAGVAVVGLVVLVYAPPVYFQRLGTIANYETEGSAMGRITAWKAGLRMAADHPITGVGAGHYAISFGTKYRPPEAQGMPWLTAHSSYFLVLGELGLPGIITFLVLTWGNIRANGKMRRFVRKRAGPDVDPAKLAFANRVLVLSSGAVLGFATAGAFLSAAYYPHVFVFTGLLLSLRNMVATSLNVSVAEALGRNPAVRKPRRGIAVPPATDDPKGGGQVATPSLGRRPQA
ncbi:O-antigen ligase family protein [Steroidobacter sp. S1-65]|uniref:O-antigen ligase family protein n=1 Tax=Steroidobacter gossypii TaxID=2805490 RepID=A0ABS1WZ04_9GAMM|nr:O-antigen ligase family protein [Steroidobacter gossypii]MBM0106211.1 O-antigen ligase family protein [Steroidobacter gossypii]